MNATYTFTAKTPNTKQPHGIKNETRRSFVTCTSPASISFASILPLLDAFFLPPPGATPPFTEPAAVFTLTPALTPEGGRSRAVLGCSLTSAVRLDDV